MARKLITADLHESVRTLAQRLEEAKVSGAPVLDDRGCPVGVVSTRDLCRTCVRPASTDSDEDEPDCFYYAADYAGLTDVPSDALGDWNVSDIMTPFVVSVPEDAPVRDVAEQMRKWHIHRILVTREGRLTGLVSASDIVALVADGHLT
jgi:CBS domain-containing protein